MIVTKIKYTKHFAKDLKKLPHQIQSIAFSKEKLFKVNPLHPSLRLHELRGKLAGLWSISITQDYRIIFERMPNGHIFFISIGKHGIYKKPLKKLSSAYF